MDINDYVFDLDGTLVDSVPGIDAALRLACLEVGLAPTVPSLRCYIGPPIRVMLAEALAILDTVLLERLESAFRRYYDQDAWKNSTPYPGVDSTLHLLRERGGKLCLLTNKPRLPTSRILDHLGWTSLFDCVMTPDAPGFQFSRKEAGAVALRKYMNLISVETLLVGDSQDDWQAARAAGFHFAAASWGYGAADKFDPENLLNFFQEILNISSRNS